MPIADLLVDRAAFEQIDANPAKPISFIKQEHKMFLKKRRNEKILHPP